MHRGFSLIELLIVISIVGILAAIAVPAYQQYSTRVKISAAHNFLNAQVSKFVQFYYKNGQFPTMAQLGFTPSSGNIYTTEPQTNANNYIGPYVATLFSEPNLVAGTCEYGNLGVSISNLDGVASDFTSIGKRVSINVFIFDVGGAIRQFCVVDETDYENLAAVSTLSIHGCINSSDVAGMGAMEAEIAELCNV